ncbi:hypothetical protein IEQ34_026772 [Dendrobium chrysotoxum]|uniref:Uncharacterized protein n=1 Tax=Dendrobium chrysotoxum TaxID=161865 RepID=A0AAV7FLM7_DENCH|nr:hypothetical protein IEQ34_026772 [Dendrobium chrysotoxum]
MPELEEKLDIMFGRVVATGADVWVPNSVPKHKAFISNVSWRWRIVQLFLEAEEFCLNCMAGPVGPAGPIPIKLFNEKIYCMSASRINWTR